ncbi:MAG: hypothetical protein PWP55_988 [Clostridiales bacterium]|nr:hypothetical protein [Clostridiales bacterium]
MIKDYRVYKADFHVHTAFSDNRDAMTVKDYIKLSQKNNIQILGLADHHHNLTQEAWQLELDDIKESHGDVPLVLPGYEITFIDGHMVITDKRTFDAEYIKDAKNNILKENDLRIVAHPDNNNCKWLMGMVYKINSVEVANGGQGMCSVGENSPYNGLKTWKDYLLMRQHASPMANSDCHQAVHFGKVWTGVFLNEESELTEQAVRQALLRGHTFASIGELRVNISCGDDIVMGDCIGLGERYYDIHWECPGAHRVTLFCGDMSIGVYYEDHGRYTPTLNGPYWILAQQDEQWAVSAPIWVSAVPTTSRICLKDEIYKNDVINVLDYDISKKLEWIKRLKGDNALVEPYIDKYVGWFESFLIRNLNNDEFTNKALDIAVAENIRRLRLIQQNVGKLLNGVLHKIYGDDGRNVLIANLDDKPYRGLIKADIKINPDWDGFGLYDEREDELPSASSIWEYRDFIDEQRPAYRMKEVITWLERGEMHEYKVCCVDLQCDADKVKVSFDLYPYEFIKRDVAWPKEARLLRDLLKNDKINSYFLHVRKMKDATAFFAVDMPPCSTAKVFIREKPKYDKDPICVVQI